MARNRTHPPTNWLEKLVAETSTARKVRQWVAEHAHPNIGRECGSGLSDEIEELDRIAALMELPHTTHPWHAAPAKDRRAWINRVKAKVSDLQALLKDPAAPPSPPLAALLVRDPQIRIPALEDTSLHDLLGNLAGHVEALGHMEPPDKRPQTGSPEARRFAKFMASYFQTWFQVKPPPYAVIAALVRIRYPSVKVAGTTVRDWIK
jgi:hypothetical protein